jgi:hypothetical protein
MRVLCCAAKHFSYIPPVLVVWRCITSQTGAWAVGNNMENEL